MRKKILSLALLAPFALAAVSCDRMGSNRWATTENTNVQIDWDQVNQAYKAAEGPEDFERRVNEIYTGDEIISVAVQDKDARTQVVTGFFDRNQSGTVEEGEKIFTIQRDVTGEGTGQYQTMGYGTYAGYHSPVFDIASGMLLGSMLSGAFRPGYAPVYYGRPYTTSLTRANDLRVARSSYRAANPSKFSPGKASGSGRRYGTGSPSRGFGRSSGGTRFGVRRRSGAKPVRLDA